MVGLLLCTSFSAALFAMASSSRVDILFPSSTDSGGHVSIVLPYSIDATDIRSIKQRIFLHPNVVSRGCVRDIVHVHEPLSNAWWLMDANLDDYSAPSTSASAAYLSSLYTPLSNFFRSYDNPDHFHKHLLCIDSQPSLRNYPEYSGQYTPNILLPLDLPGTHCSMDQPTYLSIELKTLLP